MMPQHPTRAASAYRNVAIDSRGAVHDQYDLVAMMYETVLECLAMSRRAIEERDVLLKVQKINHAMRIIQEGLLTNLDMRNGGELATNLYNLYNYSIMRLTQANANNDAAAVEEVTALLRSVYDAWKQIRQGVAAAPADVTAAPQGPAEPPVARRQAFDLNRASGSLHYAALA